MESHSVVEEIGYGPGKRESLVRLGICGVGVGRITTDDLFAEVFTQSAEMLARPKGLTTVSRHKRLDLIPWRFYLVLKAIRRNEDPLRTTALCASQNVLRMSCQLVAMYELKP
jgi:hypothetical protein